MALKAAYEIRCVCGAAFAADSYEYVFAEHDPHLRDAILSGEFNRAACPSCGRGLPVGNRFLYRDEKNRLWVWVCGKEEEPKRAELMEELIGKDAVIEGHFLDHGEDYRKFLVFGRIGLIGLLLEEDRALRRSEGKRLRERPALRWIPEGGEDPAYLFLAGNKVRVAMPLKSPEEPGSLPASAGERKRWLQWYSRGLNLHNPCSSFLNRRMRKGWNRIRQEEGACGGGDEFEDFAGSWAAYRMNAKRFRERCPERSAFFDGLKGLKVSRQVRSLRP